MRAGWSQRLRDELQRGDSSAGLIAEVAVVGDSQIKNTRTDWSGGARTNVDVMSGGGVRLSTTSTTRISHTTATDPTDVIRLTNGSPFDGLLVEWYGSQARNREFRNFTARLHPRLDAGEAKEVAYWVCEFFRVSHIGDDDIRVELLGQRQVAATGEVAADVTFTFSGYNGTFPRAGDPPTGTSTGRPMTIIRIVALRADGTIAGNVSWEGSSTGGDSQSVGGTYDVRHYTFNDLPGTSGVTSWFLSQDRTDLPRFVLNEATYADGDVEFAGGAAIPDLTGSGEVRVVLRGVQPSNSAIRGFVWNGSAYVRCYDGDVIGIDNRTTIGGEVFGADLSGVPTTGPWNMRVYLDASSDGLSTPEVRDFGLEKLATTPLIGAARVEGGGQRIANLTALKGSIAHATVSIAKSGERDYDDYGSRILAQNHIGQIEVRVLVGDLSGTRLARSEWMLHSVWEIETYDNLTDSHRLRVLSPLRRLRKPVPPFVTVGEGPAGTRTAFELSDTILAAWLEVLDTLLAMPSRYIGTGPLDDTTTIADTLRKADGKDLLDAIAYLDGAANVESQGRIKAVRIMHDDPADEAPVFRLPLGTYEPLSIGPGFDARTDEFFVRYNWSEADQAFEDERRHVNLAALENLGGAGLNTTQELRDEVCRLIRTEALADAVGRRVPKHFGTGELLWHVRPMERMPHIEIGDVGIIETDMFVARAPITGRELRGPLATLCIVVGTDDAEGTGLWLWVPSYELMTVLTGASDRVGFSVPEVSDLTYAFNSSGELVVSLRANGAGSVRVAAGATRPSDATVDAATPADVDSDGLIAFNLGGGYPSDVTVAARAFAFTGGIGPSSDVTVSSVFKVTYLEAEGGTIGGWEITDTDLIAGGSSGVRIESDTRRILMGAASAPLTGIGLFLGLDGSDWEFRAGNPAGDYIHWDGTDLTISGEIEASGGSIGGWDITATDIIAGSGSARVVFESDTQRIMLGAATAPLTGNGIFAGLSGGEYQFRVGDPSGDYLLYDGAALVLAGEIVQNSNLIDLAVTGDKVDFDTLTAIHIASLNFSTKTLVADTGSVGGWLMSGSTLHSAPSGNRITIDAANETITIGAASAPMTGIGIFMGSDGATGYDFRVGDPAGEYIHFDASLGTFEVNVESFTADNPVFEGTLTLQAGAGATRFVFDVDGVSNAALEMYDLNANLALAFSGSTNNALISTGGPRDLTITAGATPSVGSVSIRGDEISFLVWDGSSVLTVAEIKETGIHVGGDIVASTALRLFGSDADPGSANPGIRVDNGAVGGQPRLQFFRNSTPVGQPIVTGSRGGNAALTSALSALASLGLIDNSTT